MFAHFYSVNTPALADWKLSTRYHRTGLTRPVWQYTIIQYFYHTHMLKINRRWWFCVLATFAFNITCLNVCCCPLTFNNGHAGQLEGQIPEKLTTGWATSSFQHYTASSGLWLFGSTPDPKGFRSNGTEAAADGWIHGTRKAFLLPDGLYVGNRSVWSFLLSHGDYW